MQRATNNKQEKVKYIKKFKKRGFQENKIMSQTTDNLVENDFSKNDIISEETEEEELDPRVQEELEKLNQHTDQINKLELKLEDANCLFRTLLTDSTHQLKALASKIGRHNIHL